MLSASRSIRQPITVAFRDVFRCWGINSSYRPGAWTTARRCSALRRRIQPQFPVSVPVIPRAAGYGGGPSARSPPEIVSQHEREADDQHAHSDAHQHQSSSCGPERCTLPWPPPLVWEGCGPDRAGRPRRVIRSASRENKRVLSQFFKPPAATTRIIEGAADKISSRNQPRDHKGRVKTGVGSSTSAGPSPA
jgi:hypothetical protein